MKINNIAAWSLLFLTYIGWAVDFLLQGDYSYWFMAGLVVLLFVRQEALHTKLDKFIVVDDDNEED